MFVVLIVVDAIACVKKWDDFMGAAKCIPRMELHPRPVQSGDVIYGKKSSSKKLSLHFKTFCVNVESCAPCNLNFTTCT